MWTPDVCVDVDFSGWMAGFCSSWSPELSTAKSKKAFGKKKTSPQIPKYSQGCPYNYCFALLCFLVSSHGPVMNAVRFVQENLPVWLSSLISACQDAAMLGHV